jgi:hypothetical protein
VHRVHNGQIVHRVHKGIDVHKGTVVVRTAPDPSSQPAGVAADRAGVPVKCETPNGWLRIDPDAYLPVTAVSLTTAPRPC